MQAMHHHNSNGSSPSKSNSKGNNISRDAAMRRVEEVQRLDWHFPRNYDVDSPIQLLPARQVDTTERSYVHAATAMRFDAEGFKAGDPLRKDLFYIPPYLTCSACNSITVIDAIRLRSSLATVPPELRQGAFNEALPACEKCGRADRYSIGVADFTQWHRDRQLEEARQRERERQAVIVVQRAYRFYLRRMLGKALRVRMIVVRLLYATAATFIQRIARGRLGRRRYATEKCLKVIKETHPVLLATALKNTSTSKVFWYDTEEQLSLLFSNYVELMRRKGFNPPRYVVEANIREITERIITRSKGLITRVQKRWRGIIGRRMVKVYRSEVIRVRQIRVAASFVIQRVYRAYIARRRLRVLRLQLRKEQVQTGYLAVRQSLAHQTRTQQSKEKLITQYQRVRAYEQTTRAVGKSLPPAHGGKRIAAFMKSSYSDDKGMIAAKAVVARTVEAVQIEQRHDKVKVDRKQFVRQRLKQNPQLQNYYSAEMNAIMTDVIATATKTRPVTKFAKALQRASTGRTPTKLKYNYPAHIGEDVLAWLEDVEEQLHTTVTLRKLNMVPLTQLANLRISKDDAIEEVEEEDDEDDD